MKLSAETPWLADPKGQALCATLENAGHQALFVGGCVRNAVLNEAASDVDIATDAKPQRVIELAKAAGFQPVPTGIDHGTITVVVESEGFEITTFRRDVETDGRRAVVAFSDRIEDDARRRDFTMNALYAKSDGQILDPLGGLPDALAGRVRFIQDAAMRIREDYLRTLRFFRFSAYYGDPEVGFDPEALAAIADTLDGLDSLSAERVGAEMQKLLAARDPARSLATMDQVGVLARILPVQSLPALAPLIAAEEQTETPPDSLRRLAALNPIEAPERLRLSRKDARVLSDLIQARDASLSPKALGYRLGETRGWDAFMLRQSGLGQPVDQATKADVRSGSKCEFPVKAADLQPDFQGAALGEKLRELEAQWLVSDLTLDRAALLG